jgi:hypothetical protein
MDRSSSPFNSKASENMPGVDEDSLAAALSLQVYKRTIAKLGRIDASSDEHHPTKRFKDGSQPKHLVIQPFTLGSREDIDEEDQDRRRAELAEMLARAAAVASEFKSPTRTETGPNRRFQRRNSFVDRKNRETLIANVMDRAASLPVFQQGKIVLPSMERSMRSPASSGALKLPKKFTCISNDAQQISGRSNGGLDKSFEDR